MDLISFLFQYLYNFLIIGLWKRNWVRFTCKFRYRCGKFMKRLHIAESRALKCLREWRVYKLKNFVYFEGFIHPIAAGRWQLGIIYLQVRNHTHQISSYPSTPYCAHHIKRLLTKAICVSYMWIGYCQLLLCALHNDCLFGFLPLLACFHLLYELLPSHWAPPITLGSSHHVGLLPSRWAPPVAFGSSRCLLLPPGVSLLRIIYIIARDVEDNNATQSIVPDTASPADRRCLRISSAWEILFWCAYSETQTTVNELLTTLFKDSILQSLFLDFLFLS